MNDELNDEVEAINAIYGDSTLLSTAENGEYVLTLPGHAGDVADTASVRISFPSLYPQQPPVILRSETVPESSPKGAGAQLVSHLTEIVRDVFVPGEVCMFAVLEEFAAREPDNTVLPTGPDDTCEDVKPDPGPAATLELAKAPNWTLSDVFTEKKSVFICRAVAVHNVTEAKSNVYHLVSTDKKVAKASHNITAWRIMGDNGVQYQDCDDDGETAAGGRLLHLLQLMNAWNVMVVVTRWYGGVHLGPDRFRIINSAARDALVKGGFAKP